MLVLVRILLEGNKRFSSKGRKERKGRRETEMERNGERREARRLGRRERKKWEEEEVGRSVGGS